MKSENIAAKKKVNGSLESVHYSSKLEGMVQARTTFNGKSMDLFNVMAQLDAFNGTLLFRRALDRAQELDL